MGLDNWSSLVSVSMLTETGKQSKTHCTAVHDIKSSLLTA